MLKDNVSFHLEAGATLLGSTELSDYRHESGPPKLGDANGKHLIFAREAKNVILSGAGTIDGQGRAFLGAEQAQSSAARRRVARCGHVRLEAARPSVADGRILRLYEPANRGCHAGQRGGLDVAAD